MQVSPHSNKTGHVKPSCLFAYVLQALRARCSTTVYRATWPLRSKSGPILGTEGGFPGCWLAWVALDWNARRWAEQAWEGAGTSPAAVSHAFRDALSNRSMGLCG